MKREPPAPDKIRCRGFHCTGEFGFSRFGGSAFGARPRPSSYPLRATRGSGCPLAWGSDCGQSPHSRLVGSELPTSAPVERPLGKRRKRPRSLACCPPEHKMQSRNRRCKDFFCRCNCISTNVLRNQHPQMRKTADSHIAASAPPPMTSEFVTDVIHTISEVLHYQRQGFPHTMPRISTEPVERCPFAAAASHRSVRAFPFLARRADGAEALSCRAPPRRWPRGRSAPRGALPRRVRGRASARERTSREPGVRP